MLAVQRPTVAQVPNAARGALVGTALCAVTMLSVTWTLLATGWVDGAGGSLVVAIAAVFEAAVLAYARVPRIVATVLIPVLALAAIIPATISVLPFDSDASFLHLIGRYLGASFGGLAATADWPFTVGLCALLWLCAFWMTWVALREHRGVLAVIPVYIILATNVLNAHAGHSPALPTVLTVGFTFLVIANAHLDDLEARWQKRRIQSLPGIRSGMVGSTAIIAVGILLLGSLLPRATSLDISGQFFTNGGNATGHGGGTEGRAPGAPAQIGFNGATQPGGPLVSNPHAVLTYTDDTSAPIYLRVINDTDFISGSWFPEKSGISFDNGIAFDGIQYQGGSLPRDRDRGDGAVASATATVTAQIVLKAGATGDVNQALFPGDAQKSSASGLAYGTVDLGKGGGALLTVDSVQLNNAVKPGATLTTSGTIPTATDAQLRAAGTNYPAFTDRYTQLDDDATNGAARIAALARQWTAGTNNAYDAATAIQQHLRNPAFFTYTLSPPTAPQNQWPIVYFLTSSHRGYCQYFASSMGAMLRSLGIPTRLVNGYGPGTAQALGTGSGKPVRQVTTSDAHTWVEAYFPSYGWIPFEPTPPSAQGDYLPITRGGLPNQPATGPGAPDQPPGFAEPPVAPVLTAPPPPAPARPTVPAPDVRLIGLSVLGAAGLILLVALLWLLLPRSQRGVWRRLEVVGRVLGVRRRADETHRAYARRFAAWVTRIDTREMSERENRRNGRLSQVISELAHVSAANEFARPDKARSRSHGIRRLWLTVFGASPALAWRALMHRSPAR